MLQLQRGRSLKEFSTFGIGGPIRFFAEMRSLEDAREAFAWIVQEKIPYLILGKGSNCLFSDIGFDGLVLLNKIDHCSWKENGVEVGAGYSFSLLGAQSARKGLSGLEFASGIPATVGGAVFMNAGANGQETCDVLQSVQFLHLDGSLETFPKKTLHFSYRTSSFQTMQGAIVSASFVLTPSEKARPAQLTILSKRMETQPYKEKSIGCIFRNPAANVFAGKLIDECGLKGLQIGGVKISEMHANFIVNVQEASAQNVLELIEIVRKKVFEKTGYELEIEARMVGFL